MTPSTTPTKPPSASISFPKPCIWKIGRCGYSCGIPVRTWSSVFSATADAMFYFQLGRYIFGMKAGWKGDVEPTRFISQERFRSLIPSYIRDSSVAVVVYVSFHGIATFSKMSDSFFS